MWILNLSGFEATENKSRYRNKKFLDKAARQKWVGASPKWSRFSAARANPPRTSSSPSGQQLCKLIAIIKPSIRTRQASLSFKTLYTSSATASSLSQDGRLYRSVRELVSTLIPGADVRISSILRCCHASRPFTFIANIVVLYSPVYAVSTLLPCDPIRRLLPSSTDASPTAQRLYHRVYHADISIAILRCNGLHQRNRLHLLRRRLRNRQVRRWNLRYGCPPT